MAPKKKGLSNEEKLQKLHSFFTKSHSFYTVKELEKDASKYTGISSMIIKDLVQQLVDDNKVSVEKCGITNLYWSFKYDEYNALNQRLIKEEEKFNDRQRKIEQLKVNIQTENSVRIPSETRSGFLSKYQNLSKLKLKLQESLQKFDKTSNMRQLDSKNTNLLEAIEFFTDSLECMVYYFTKVNAVGISEKELRAKFDLPEEFENIPIWHIDKH